jgi:hypothetical protein
MLSERIRGFINTHTLFCNPFPYIVCLPFSGLAFLSFMVELDKGVFSFKYSSMTLLLLAIGIVGSICCFIQDRNFKNTEE